MGVALITPFLTNGGVDYITLSHLVEYQIKNGTDYLVILGTTAETPTLTDREKKRIIKHVVNKVNKRIPIVAGIGGNNTQAVIENLQSGDFSGIDAILSTVPYYNKPPQEGIYQHYKKIAEATPLPVILYNVPGRTGVNMEAETVLRLARDVENIVAIKEASGNILQAETIIKNKPADFKLISGDDGITLQLIKLGAVGVISVIGNALPLEFGNMVHLALHKHYEQANDVNMRLKKLMELLFVDGNPAGIKSVLDMMGYIENVLRLPLIPAQIETYKRIHSELRKLNIKLYV